MIIFFIRKMYCGIVFAKRNDPISICLQVLSGKLYVDFGFCYSSTMSGSINHNLILWNTLYQSDEILEDLDNSTICSIKYQPYLGNQEDFRTRLAEILSNSNKSKLSYIQQVESIIRNDSEFSNTLLFSEFDPKSFGPEIEIYNQDKSLLVSVIQKQTETLIELANAVIEILKTKPLLLIPIFARVQTINSTEIVSQIKSWIDQISSLKTVNIDLKKLISSAGLSALISNDILEGSYGSVVHYTSNKKLPIVLRAGQKIEIPLINPSLDHLSDEILRELLEVLDSLAEDSTLYDDLRTQVSLTFACRQFVSGASKNDS